MPGFARDLMQQMLGPQGGGMPGGAMAPNTPPMPVGTPPMGMSPMPAPIPPAAPAPIPGDPMMMALLASMLGNPQAPPAGPPGMVLKDPRGGAGFTLSPEQVAQASAPKPARSKSEKTFKKPSSNRNRQEADKKKKEGK